MNSLNFNELKNKSKYSPTQPHRYLYRNQRYHPLISRHHRNRYNNTIDKLHSKITEPSTYITNLSSKTLTTNQSRVLTLGLKFVPSRRMHKNTMTQSIDKFERSNRLKFHFRNHPESEPHPFRPKSTWTPPRASQDIETYLQRIRTSLINLPDNNLLPNLTKNEYKALKELAADNSLVIKNADKGSGIVVEDVQKYIQDGLDHLSDTDIYEEVPSDPTKQLTTAINTFIQKLYNQGIIDNTTKEYLSFNEQNPPRTQQLYFLKKIHKNPIAVRPIVSGCGGPTEKISQLVDLHLQPYVSKVNSYIKDSGHIINLIEKLKIPPNCILTTIDVKALYLNIPHKEGIQAVLNRLYHNNRDSNEVPIPPESMRDLINIVLTKNYFQFADKMYHQIQGTAMGTKMAPAYANLFMAELEEQLLRPYPIQPITWRRYIDDVLCIWPGSETELTDFINYINSKHPSIKFTYEHSHNTIDFLDLTIYKGERYKQHGILDIKPFFKKTNKFQYLEYSSAHPKKTFKSLIKGELTRLLRACSDKQEYLNVQQKIYKAFKDRGYPPSLIKNVQASVPYENRPQMIDEKDKQPCPYDTFLVLQYTPDMNTAQLQSILKPTATEEPNIPKPCLSLKKSKSIGKTLVKAKLKEYNDPPESTEPVIITTTPNMNGHSAGCATPGCKCCRAMSRKPRITSSSNYKSFPTPMHTNCNSSNVIYLLECTKCTNRNQYVGQTKRTLSQRIAGHRAACRIKTTLPIYKHFSSSKDHIFNRDIKLTILEKTTANNLTTRESYWINALDTVHPRGLNSRFE